MAVTKRNRPQAVEAGPTYPNWDGLKLTGIVRNPKGRPTHLIGSYDGRTVEISATPDGFIYIGPLEEAIPADSVIEPIKS